MGPKVAKRRPAIAIAFLVSALFLPAPSRSDEESAVWILSKNAADTRAALLAVEYWSDPKRPDLPEHLRPIPLVEAARTLAADAQRGPYGASRRNRAIVKLTLAGLSLGSDGRAVHEHRQALEILGAPIERIDALIHEIGARPRPDPTVTLDWDQLLAWIRPALSLEFFRLLVASSPIPPLVNCSWLGIPSTVSEKRHGFQTFPCSDIAAPNDAEVVATTSVMVRRQFQELAELMDPQNWDAQSSPPDHCNVYFEETKVVTLNLQSGDWEAHKCPASPGTAWSAPLQEKFRMEFGQSPGSLSTSVATILDIDASPSSNPSNFMAMYRLNEHIFTNIGSDTRGEIDLDKGYSAVGSGASGTNEHKVGGEKRVRFTGWKSPATRSNPNPPDDSAYYNTLACYSLKAMGDALQEFVCCPVPPPTCERLPRPRLLNP